MEVTINTLSDCDREMDITMTTEELQPHFEDAYKKALPSIEIKGFRKGKVPLTVVKKMFGKSIEYQTVEDLTNETFRKEAESRNLNPIGVPTITKLNFKPGEPLSFKVKFEVKPEFEIKDLSSISIEKYIHAATEEEIEKEVTRLQQINASFEPAEKIENENFAVTVDMQEFDEQGNIIPGNKRENLRLSLMETSVEKEVKEALIGAGMNEIRDAKFEHSHGDHSHKVHLQLTVRGIEKAILPEANDELAKKVSNNEFSTIAELKENIKKDLNDFWKERSDRRFENDLLNEIVKQYEFAVPESLVAGFLDAYVDDLKNRQPNKTFPRGFDEKKYRESYRGIALWQAKWLLIKDALIAKEKIEITETDIEKTAEAEAGKLGIDKERLISYYKSSEQAAEKIKYDRLFDILKRSVKLTEVETADYSKFTVE
ncbi:MAG: trigger factor [Bacteroidetes bacterium]|nr:trigger factor [Bacteroidota bacterium]